MATRLSIFIIVLDYDCAGAWLGSVQLFDQRGPIAQHGALIERTFVGDFMLVDGGRLFHQHRADYAAGTAGAGHGEFLEQLAEFSPYVFVARDIWVRSVGGQLGTKRAAGFDVRKDQRSDIRTIVTRKYDIAQIGGAMREKLRAQRSHANPGAGGEFEILRDAAVEDESFGGIVGVDREQRVAQAIEAFVIEDGARQIGLTPITGSDAGTAKARFGLLSCLH